MSDVGFVRLYRSLLGHTAFRNDAEAMAFGWMILRAAWKPARVRYKDRMINLERGQLAISTRDMANAMDRDKAWIERLWSRLKTETMIKTHAETGVTVVTICNYDDFQASRDSDETPVKTAGETEARQARDTEQRREEVKKKIDDDGVARERETLPIVVDFPNGLMGLADRICRAGGVRNVDPRDTIRNMDLVKGWIAEGFDPEAVILPAVQSAVTNATEPIHSLRYFDAAIRQYRARQEAQANGHRRQQSAHRNVQPSAAIALKRRAQARLAQEDPSSDDGYDFEPWAPFSTGSGQG